MLSRVISSLKKLFFSGMMAGLVSPLLGKPNVLLIYVDDMGYLPGIYGGDLLQTPHMDALIESGIRFTDGYVSSPICGPSRVGLMTGRYQARSGHDANSRAPGQELDISETTMGERMQALGYRTGLIGKWHLGSTEPKFMPNARGFDYFIGHEGNVNEGPELYFKNGTQIGEIPSHPVTSPLWGTEACAFIERNQQVPFFLYLAFNAVHTPHVAEESTFAEFEHIQQKNLKNYAAITRELDNAIGAVVGKLEELELRENTLVFFISDNGKAFSPAYENDGFRGRKWTVLEGGVRVPYAVSWPGEIPKGKVSSEPVIQLDVLPTVVAAAGGAVEHDWELDGINLMPLLVGKSDALPDRAFYWRFCTQWAIRQGKWKLVNAFKDRSLPVLFNLEQDMGETVDLRNQYPEIVESLQRKYDAWNARMQPARLNDKRAEEWKLNFSEAE